VGAAGDAVLLLVPPLLGTESAVEAEVEMTAAVVLPIKLRSGLGYGGMGGRLQRGKKRVKKKKGAGRM
jgi:hypothetical protein